MNERILINVLLIAVSLVLAVFLGSWVVSAPKEVGMGFALVLALVVFIKLGKNLWILIPVSMTLGIRFPFLPGGFSMLELVSMYVVTGSFFLLLSHKVSLRISMTSIEWCGVSIGLLMAQSFFRNPVGIMALGTENVGGRPYVIVIIGIASAWVLSSTRTEHGQIRKSFQLSILGYFGTSLVKVMATASGTIATYTAPLLGIGGGGDGAADNGKAGRSSTAASWGEFVSRLLVAVKNPLKAIIHPFWLIVLMSVIVGAGMSGFRSMIAIMGITLLLGVYYWGRARAVLLAAILAFTCYIGINVINIVMPLPANIQRSLSFLPGSWDDAHLEDASASTDWRVLMWEEALFTDGWIRNKWFGDGLGIQRSDFLRMRSISEARVLTDEMSQERAMLAGDFHSGPVTTIKVIGYVGLFVLIISMFIVAIRAHSLIMYSRYRPYFREVMFFCLPLVYMPIIFLFIFGSFKTSIPIWFTQIGLLRLLENNLKNRNDEEVLATEN